jgi:hypothetical protein
MSVAIDGVEKYKGAVLAMYERNGYHDSDFFAVVWNQDSQSVIGVEYGTTRFGNGGYADVDATPEVIDLAKQYKKTVETRHENQLQALRNKLMAPGITVQVKLSRGKNKHLDGSLGTVFWVGNGYAKHSIRVGVEVSGERIFVDSKNLLAIEDGKAVERNWEMVGHEIKSAMMVQSLHYVYRLPF